MSWLRTNATFLTFCLAGAQDIEKAGGHDAVCAILGDNASTVKCACKLVKKKHLYRFVCTTGTTMLDCHGWQGKRSDHKVV